MSRVPPFDRPATYDDLMKLPDICVAEIVGGELHSTPRPAPPHGRAGAILQVSIGGPYDQGRGGPGDWWIPTHAGSEVVRAEPFDASEWELAALWTDPP